MNFRIQEVQNKYNWEKFLLGCEEKTFLQSWNWGEFQKKTGDKIWRLGVYNNNELQSVALTVKISAKRGTFLFCPHAPILKKQTTENKKQILSALLDEFKKISMKERASFIRISPIWEQNQENNKIFKSLGFRDSPIHMHPELTWELNTTSIEDELLTKMRKTTRYLIKQAQKNPDVKINKSTQLIDVGKFNELYQKTVDRHHFTPFSLNYLKSEVLAFLPDNQIMIFLGEYKGELLASAIIIFWQGAAFYHQGASSLKYPKIPVSYLLQWEAIKEAKERGCHTYNFWGIIAPISKFNVKGQASGKHPWAGLTLFKTGFGGYKKEYVKTQDLPLSLKYWLNYAVEKIRKSKRGL